MFLVFHLRIGYGDEVELRIHLLAFLKGEVIFSSIVGEIRRGDIEGSYRFFLWQTIVRRSGDIYKLTDASVSGEAPPSLYICLAECHSIGHDNSIYPLSICSHPASECVFLGTKGGCR